MYQRRQQRRLKALISPSLRGHVNPQMSWSYSFSMRLPQQGSHSSRRRCWRKLRSACSSADAALRRAYPILVFLCQAGNPPQPPPLLHFRLHFMARSMASKVFPSSRLLALTSTMVAEKEIRWLPWRFRLSAKAQDDNLMIRPKKLPRHP